eukprot:3975499-Amphidinium_carterae.1
MEKVDPEGTFRDSQGRLRDSKTKRYRVDPNKTPSTSRKSRGGRSASATPREEEEEQDRSRSGDEQHVSQLTTLPNSVANTGEKRIRIVTIPLNSVQGSGTPCIAIATLPPSGARAKGDQSVKESSKLLTSSQVMSPNSLGALQWSINSQPPTPRDAGDDEDQTPLQTDYEEAFNSVCCQCGEMMPPEE